MEKIDTMTADIIVENEAKLLELFPQVATEIADENGEVRRAIDFDALRALFGDVAEGQRERYQFTWPGKTEARAKAQTPINKTMLPQMSLSKNWSETENLYIEGDNLDALKLLRETYAGRVRCIYIDPPYNTGHDFLYNDDRSQSLEEYESESGDFDELGNRMVQNTAATGRFHSKWCSDMYPKLMLARDLLSEDGVIFISIDDNELHNLRKICESPDVFGGECFIADISWQRTYSKRNDSLGIAREVEHILVYSKRPEWQPFRLPRTEDMNSLYESQDGDLRPWSSVTVNAPGAATHQGMVYAIQQPLTGDLLYPPVNRCWTFGQPQMLEYMNEWAE